MNVLFLYLKAFSFTGGIEKFNRSFLKALHELSVDGRLDAEAVSPYDSVTDEKYFPRLRFKGYKGNRLLFLLNTFSTAWRYDVLILGHINLAIIGYLIKRIKPSVKLVIIAHGIEVWKTHKGHKLKVLEQADLILSVSNFTKYRILAHNPTVVADKISIFPNTIDPYFKLPAVFDKPQYLLDRYRLDKSTKIMLTITRLSSSEKYKGYDNIIQLMDELIHNTGEIKYLIGGKADPDEKRRVETLIAQGKRKDAVSLLGFIKDSELIDHYLLADVFVMQSKKEGFGIVFIEALACGRKVIAGSKDGSAEALLQGELGKLIDPDSKAEARAAIEGYLEAIQGESPAVLQQKVVDAFGFSRYKERMQEYLCNERHKKSVNG